MNRVREHLAAKSLIAQSINDIWDELDVIALDESEVIAMSGISDTQTPGNLGQIQEAFISNGTGPMNSLGKTVRQSNDFARNRLNIHDLMAVRILACLASTVREDDVNFRELSVSAKSVLEHTGGSNYKVLKMSCSKLLGCILEKKLNDRGGFQKYTLFSTIGYKDGVIFARFHPDLRSFFLGLKSHFTKYDLKEFLKLPSIYSQKLFEYLKSWDDCIERIEDIEMICIILDVPESFRSNFKDFRRRVLDKAHEDISKLTSLRYEWEAIKKGTGKTSPVTAIRFIFSPDGQSESQKAEKEARNKDIRNIRNKLFLESMKCFENRQICETPGKTGKCAACFKGRGLELPEFLLELLPEYE
jgi:plasmid replication initiation protein